MNLKALGEDLGLEEEEFRELVELLVQSGRQDLECLQAALSVGDADQVARSAHTIKGASGNLGLTTLSALAGTIEQHASNHCLEKAGQPFETLKIEFERIETEIGS